ncbi:MAG: cytochrome P450 [Dehalococcoidia bacterium]|nr:cytochrome P450 [Dehalococcoidia bacterium]
MAEAAPLVFNPLDPEFRADPYAFYVRLRSEDPVHETPYGRWVVSRYADCVSVLKDPRASSDLTKAAAYGADAPPAGGDGRGRELLDMRPFLILDPPDHTRLRGLVSKAFTPRVVEGLRPRIQQLVDGLLDRALERGSLELIEEFAYPLPVTVICEMLGVPPEDHSTFKEWSRRLARGQDPDEVLPPEVIKGRVEAMRLFMDYFRRRIAERRTRPSEDLLSALIAAEEAGEKLTEAELLATCVFLLAAGHETTVNLLGNGMLALLGHRDQLEALTNDPSLAPGAVEELLRYDTPVQFAGRIAAEDIEIGGKAIPKGRQIVVLLASANRDPQRFDEPDRLDITRQDNHHLGLGFGIHFCLGAPLARLEGEVAFRTITQRLREPRLLIDAPEYKDNVVLRGVRALPIGFSRAG